MARAIGPLKRKGLMLAMSKSDVSIDHSKRKHTRDRGGALTAAEFAGTTFPDEVMTQPDGTPATDVTAAVAVERVVAVPTHGQPV